MMKCNLFQSYVAAAAAAADDDDDASCTATRARDARELEREIECVWVVLSLSPFPPLYYPFHPPRLLFSKHHNQQQ